MAISPNSRWVVTGTGYNTATVWDLAAENPAANSRVLTGHQRAIYAVEFCPENHWIVTGSDDNTARVWDLTAKNPAASPRVLSGHQAAIRSLAISSDSRWIVTGSADATARAWRWQWDDLVALAGTVGRNFDRDEWKLYFPNEPYRKTFPELPVPGDP